MPLKPGKENIGPNIDELKKAGYDDPKQRVAIALDKAGLSNKKKSEEEAASLAARPVYALQREMKYMGQVMVRRKLQNGDNQLIRADVISEKDGVLRVKMPGVFGPVEVKANETVPATQLFGDPRNKTVIPKSYPDATHSLFRRFEKRAV